MAFLNVESQTFTLYDIYQNTNAQAPSSFPQYFTQCNGKMIFSAYTLATGVELCVSDGTQQGTFIIDIRPGSSGSTPEQFTVFDNLVYFNANTTAYGEEVWVTDGTLAGTHILKDIRAGSGSSSPSDFIVFNGYLYFGATDGLTGFELWRTKGSADSTYLFKDIVAGSGGGYIGLQSIVLGNKLIFIGRTSAFAGAEPFVTDGTPLGTSLLKDVYPGSGTSNPRDFTKVGDTVYFVAREATTGNELFLTDGTTAGTKLVRDISPGSSQSDPRNLTSYKNRLYFWASGDPAYGRELWISNGSDTGTYMFANINPGSASAMTSASTLYSAYNMIIKDSILYFNATTNQFGAELWKTDGTSGGTTMVGDVIPQPNSNLYPEFLTMYNNTIYFRGLDFNGEYKLWRSDGTLAGTELLENTVATGSWSPMNSTEEFYVFNGSIWFRGSYSPATGNELWSFTENAAAGNSLTGVISYGNTALSPLNNCIVVLADTLGNTVSTDTTDSNGVYNFENVPAGNYKLLTSTAQAWHAGAANAIDAMLILKHFVGMNSLVGIYLKGADLNADLSINSVDALLVTKRFTGFISSFPAGDWVFEEPMLEVISTPVIVNIKGINTGDVNGSYTP
jgi:ELWxxDGT repeat protein